MRAVSVDPGVNALGWALWDTSEWFELVAPLSCGVIQCGRRRLMDWEEKVRALSKQFVCDVWSQHSLARLDVEMPEHRSGPVGAAAAGRGDVAALAFAVGVLAQMAYADGAAFMPWPVSRWKGQLPKDVVERRIERAIGLRACDDSKIMSHAVDAVGVGLVAKGFDFADADTFGTGGKE